MPKACQCQQGVPLAPSVLPPSVSPYIITTIPYKDMMLKKTSASLIQIPKDAECTKWRVTHPRQRIHRRRQPLLRPCRGRRRRQSR